MEFKVIFIGFALHCVLNLVLIGKSVLIKDEDKAVVNKETQRIEQSERAMVQSLTSGEGALRTLRTETDKEGRVAYKPETSFR